MNRHMWVMSSFISIMDGPRTSRLQLANKVDITSQEKVQNVTYTCALQLSTVDLLFRI